MLTSGTRHVKKIFTIICWHELQCVLRTHCSSCQRMMVKIVFTCQMVELGMAWVYRRYAKDSALFELERQAQVDKRGLWADPDPVAPWEYRHNKRARSAS